jgi:hypothetical protein
MNVGGAGALYIHDTMQRGLSLLRRCLGTVFACWFAMVMAQPVTVRSCPMTGGVLEQLVPGQKPAAAGHAHHMAMDVTPHEQAPVHDHEQSQCNCIGDCCASIAAPLPVLGRFVPVPERLLVVGVQFSSVEHSFDTPDYLRPPTTAPPSTQA